MPNRRQAPTIWELSDLLRWQNEHSYRNNNTSKMNINQLLLLKVDIGFVYICSV